MLVKLPYQNLDISLRTTAASRLLCLVFVVCFVSGPLCFADEPAVNPERNVSVVVDNIRLVSSARSFTGTSALTGQLELRVTVTNETADTMRLKYGVFECSVDGSVATGNPAIQDALFSSKRELAAGESTEGWLAFIIRQELKDEPKMVLSWVIDGEQTSVSLNEILRTTTNLEIKRVGPGDILAVISMPRQIDNLSIWLLNEQFRTLHQQGVERVVVEFKAPEGIRPASYTYTNSSSGPVMAWLSSATSNPKGVQVNPRPGAPVSPVRFREIYVVGASSSSRSSRSFSANRRDSAHQPDRDRAIAQALGSAYEAVSVEQALQDLQNTEAGIRRCAMESVIDRLSPVQMKQVLEDARNRSDVYQVMLAENLHRTALPDASVALDAMARGKTSSIAAAATQSLVRSVAPSAADYLKQIWHENPDDVTLRQTIATAILARNASVHTELLEEFAEQQLTRFSTTAADGQKAGAKSPSSVAASLKSILSFFRSQGNLKFEETARRELLNISDPTLQDMLLGFVLSSKPAEASQLAGQYIEQRLQVPLEGLSDRINSGLHQNTTLRASQSFTRILLSTIRKYPNPTHAARLIEFSKSSSGSSTYRSDAFRTGLRCAGEDVLQDVIADFEDLDSTRKTELLGQLSRMEHPSKRVLLEKCLEKDNTRRVAVTLLRTDYSMEGMQIVVRRLETLLKESEAEFAKQAKPSQSRVPSGRPSSATKITTSDRAIAEMMELLAGSSRRYIHPDARRVMNRLRRSPIKVVADRAALAVKQSAYTIPGELLKKIAAAYELQENGEYAESKAAFLKVMADDPFYVHAYTALASLDLREGLGKQAMERLKIADRMNPEDIHTQSMIALAEIRIGNVQGGIDLAEQILESVPDLPTSLRCDTLYNTACTYGRAIEVQKDPERLLQHRARGMALLRDCVNRTNGFHDSAHILADDDLNVFHEEGEWPELIESIREAEDKFKNVQP